MEMAYEKGSHDEQKTFHLYFYIANDYQTQQSDALWYWSTMHKVTWFSDRGYM